MKIIKPAIAFKDNPSLQKVVDDIYKNMTELANAVNNLSSVQGGENKSQTIVVSKQADGSYKIKVRHQDGFVEVDANLSTGV